MWILEEGDNRRQWSYEQKTIWQSHSHWKTTYPWWRLCQGNVADIWQTECFQFWYRRHAWTCIAKEVEAEPHQDWNCCLANLCLFLACVSHLLRLLDTVWWKTVVPNVPPNSSPLLSFTVPVNWLDFLQMSVKMTRIRLKRLWGKGVFESLVIRSHWASFLPGNVQQQHRGNYVHFYFCL